MQVLPFDKDTLAEAVKILKNGGVVAHPADTCYGLAADINNEQAFRKIQEIKGRDYKKPMSIMLSVTDQHKIENYAKLNDFSEMVAKKLFPSPVTLILPKGPAIPDFYFPENETIGIRVPMQDLTQDMLRAFGGPLITTSANPSGGDLNFNCSDTVKALQDQAVKPDLIFEGSLEKFQQASTVIQVEEDHVKILRPGPVTASYLESLLGVPVKE